MIRDLCFLVVDGKIGSAGRHAWSKSRDASQEPGPGMSHVGGGPRD